MSNIFISTEELANTQNAIIVDATMSETALTDHFTARIRNAKFWDANLIKNPGQPNPAEVPTQEQMLVHMQRLKLRKTDDLIVLYD